MKAQNHEMTYPERNRARFYVYVNGSFSSVFLFLPLPISIHIFNLLKFKFKKMVLFFHCFPRACDVLGRLQVRKHWSVCGCSKSEAVPEVSGRPNVSKVGYQFCLKNGARGLHR